MTLTLLELCKRVARDAKTAVPNTIISNAELEAVQLLQAARSTMQDLLKRVDWEELIAEATITTVASTQAYNLPSDFDRIIDETAWNVTNNDPMIGVTTAREWQYLQNSSTSTSSVLDYYRIRGGQVLIFPTPASVESLIYEYITNTPIESSGGTAQEDWLADTDVPRIDQYLVELGIRWRFRKINGKPYQEDLNEYNEIATRRIMADGGRKKICSSPRRIKGVQVAYPENVTAP